MISISECSIIDERTIKQLNEIFKSGHFINGPYNEKFAKLWASFNQKDYCVLTSSGSSALTVTLKALKEHSSFTKVIVPTFSFAATVFSVIEAGLEPVYCAVDNNLLLDQDNCLQIMDSEDILAVIPVHIYGQELVLRSEIASADVFILEDACQAHGVQIRGDAACFSFYPSKNLGTCGNGGAIVTNNIDVYEWASRYINYGDKKGEKYFHKFPSSNQRLDELQACVLVNKIRRGEPDSEIIVRSDQANFYKSLGVPTFLDVVPTNTWHIYPLLVDDPDVLVAIFKSEGIQAGRHYPYSLFDVAPGNVEYLRDFEDYSYRSHLQISLPIGSHLYLKDLDKVAKILLDNYELVGNDIWKAR